MKNESRTSREVDILLVEDNVEDARMILSTLKKACIRNRVQHVNSGAHALDFLLRTGQFKGQPPLRPETLIVLSLNLAGVESLEILRRIKSDERTRAIPVIMLAASQEDRGVMQGYKLGGNACVIKPMDLSKLVEAVSELQLGWLLISEAASAESNPDSQGEQTGTK